MHPLHFRSTRRFTVSDWPNHHGFGERLLFRSRHVLWEDVEQAKPEPMLRATPAQRLAWLEETMRLAYASGALWRNRRDPPES